MKVPRTLVLLALGLLAIGAARDVSRMGDALPWHQLYDFADFYCAGMAVNAGADPYRYEPLHGCEHAVNTGPAYRNDPARIVPAPLPPYDFPPFALLARAGFPAARVVDATAILLALAGCIAGLRILGVPLDVAALALALPAGFVLLAAGQVVPFALLALVWCGVCLAAERNGPAGLFAALTLVEPHLGLPVCAAVLLWSPRSRLWLLAAAALAAATGIATVGFAATLEYVTRVLPAQAAAETSYVYQFSLTYLLATAGVPARVALAAGDLSYALLAGFGVWLAARTAARTGRRELLAFVPAVCSVVAGPYVHMVDLPFALPAALVLATQLRGRLKDVSAIALCVLSVPWIAVWIAKKLFLASLFVTGALLFRLAVAPPLSAATFAAIAAAIYCFELAPPAAFVVTATRAAAANALAQTAWSQYVAQLGKGSLAWLAVKIPAWGALAALLAACAAAPQERTR